MSYTDLIPTGDYTIDCAQGRAFADQVIREIALTGFTPKLGHTVRDMIEIGRFDGPEVGFLQRIAEYLISVDSKGR